MSTAFKFCTSHVSNRSNARLSPRTRSPRQSTLLLLCLLVIIAEKASETTAARTPFILLAAIDIPIPVPQQSTPKLFSVATKCPT